MVGARSGPRPSARLRPQIVLAGKDDGLTRAWAEALLIHP
ncbi:hypothetical protein D554_3500 [Bordetella holmesii 30539]|nr:hypothetical protein D560_3604 [Bordetella holmesii ATCC 51541]AIT28220.1 hypothetical protein D558_3580 [Bordetella holmesii 44057]EWM41005.1 hypothetical protein D555_3650 [Bordetella holmesii 35009]EWM44107.1 hypothetical protein D556_3576 [Bordetella holmesii 41130]EWM44898.1 hypothetical protein D557_2887 [Bordetella holmesii 70147]EXF88223.1 hypothetical protein D554_3500 [Bordetella holmesii 30539]EXX94225.1 hypothetical protein D559_1634 [Bordetella holmesii 1058]KAK79719.1 hypoth